MFNADKRANHWEAFSIFTFFQTFLAGDYKLHNGRIPPKFLVAFIFCLKLFPTPGRAALRQNGRGFCPREDPSRQDRLYKKIVSPDPGELQPRPVVNPQFFWSPSRRLRMALPARPARSLSSALSRLLQTPERRTSLHIDRG